MRQFGSDASDVHILTMKTAVAFLALTASANAFAPASTSARSATAVNAAELDGMLGVGPETAGKVVSDDSILVHAFKCSSFSHLTISFCLV